MRYILLALSICILPLDAHAAEKKPAPIIDKIELKQCVDLRNGISHQVELYNAEVKASNLLLEKIQATRLEMDFQKNEIDSGDESKIGEYNIKVEQSNAMIKQHNEYKDRMAEIAIERNRLADAFNLKCAGKRFLETDMYDLKRKKK